MSAIAFCLNTNIDLFVPQNTPPCSKTRPAQLQSLGHEGESDMGYRIYSIGIPTPSRDALAPLWVCLPVLCFISLGEWDHLGAHLAGLSPAHSHVLLSLTPGYCGHSLCLQHCAPDAVNKKNNLLYLMHNAEFSLYGSW